MRRELTGVLALTFKIKKCQECKGFSTTLGNKNSRTSVNTLTSLTFDENLP